MGTSFFVPAGRADAETVVERSRFISHIACVHTEEEAKAFIEEIREEYKDATHNVPAYVIGENGEARWSSEDGEPSGTAGAPVLKLILSEGLTDTVIVTTRYFGGVKLGTGGLVRAYTDAAKKAIAEVGRAEIKIMTCFTLKAGYKGFNRLKSAAGRMGLMIENIKYAGDVVFDLLTDESNSDVILNEMSEITAGDVEIIAKTEKRKSLAK